MKKPKIKIKLVDCKGTYTCHRGHEKGDVFNFDADRGNLCPMALHVLFPYVNILRYGGHIPSGKESGDLRVCCPDPDVINVFQIIIE